MIYTMVIYGDSQMRANFINDKELYMNKSSAKQRMLNVLKQNQGSTAFTIKQAQNRFGVRNIRARISDLRKEGHSIETTVKTMKTGRKLTYYGLTKTSRSGKRSISTVAA